MKWEVGDILRKGDHAWEILEIDQDGKLNKLKRISGGLWDNCFIHTNAIYAIDRGWETWVNTGWTLEPNRIKRFNELLNEYYGESIS